MSNYIITQTDLNIVRQSTKLMYCKLELLDRNFKIVDVIEGNLISDNFTNDTNSDIRRTYSCELFVSDKSFLVGYDTKIWLDKYIRVYTGILETRSQEIAWYLQGTFTMLDTSYTFNDSTNTLSLSCSDLMSTINNDRNGQIGELKLTITEGSNARLVIIDLLSQIGITKYIVNDIDRIIPEDLEFTAGVTYYEILKRIVDLYSGLEMFFDAYGVFIIQKIPSCLDDQVMIDDSLLDYAVVSENTACSFKEIYNKVEVWGQQIECDELTGVCTYENNIYKATFEDITELEDGNVYCIPIPQTNLKNVQLAINSFGTFPITIDDGTAVDANAIPINKCAFKYRHGDKNFYYLGQYQVHTVVAESNLKNPLHPENLGQTILKVCEGSDYEKIYSDSLACDRAKYELYKACRLTNTITLEMLAIPWLDVNWKVEYTSLETKETNQYIIKSINGSSSQGTMSVTMISFYDDDPFKYWKGVEL